MPYYVYIMTNKTNEVLYTGVTNDIERRALEHKLQVRDGFTKMYNVKKLVYAEELETPSEAIEAEKRIKGWTRKKKVALVESINPTWNDLSGAGGDASPGSSPGSA
jgi:putative endonuclease